MAVWFGFAGRHLSRERGGVRFVFVVVLVCTEIFVGSVFLDFLALNFVRCGFILLFEYPIKMRRVKKAPFSGYRGDRYMARTWAGELFFNALKPPVADKIANCPAVLLEDPVQLAHRQSMCLRDVGCAKSGVGQIGANIVIYRRRIPPFFQQSIHIMISSPAQKRDGINI